MKSLNKLSALFRFHDNQEGATSVEYAVMLALIAAVCISTITLVGDQTQFFWSNNSQELGDALTN